MTDPRSKQDADGNYYLDLGPAAEALRAYGLLCEYNTKVLHPDGFEARVSEDGRLLFYGDGRHLKQWTAEQVGVPPTVEDPDTAGVAEDLRRKVEQTRLDAKQFNWPGYHKGHSPGFNAAVPAGTVR